jgi:hypothetical protein
MNTTLLIQQLTVAILASAIVIPAVQKIKGWLPDARFVEPVSVVLSFLVGMGVAFYYASYSVLDSAIVGFFSVIGAEGIYQLLGDKLKSYVDKAEPADSLSKVDLSAEVAHLINEEE